MMDNTTRLAEHNNNNNSHFSVVQSRIKHPIYMWTRHFFLCAFLLPDSTAFVDTFHHFRHCESAVTTKSTWRNTLPNPTPTQKKTRRTPKSTTRDPPRSEPSSSSSSSSSLFVAVDSEHECRLRNETQVWTFQKQQQQQLILRNSTFVGGGKLQEATTTTTTQSKVRTSPYSNESMMAELPTYALYANETVASDLDTLQTETTTNGKSKLWLSHRSLWKRRNARSADEGIRREKLPQLSQLLEKAKALDSQSPRYAARTIAGLVSALAEEVDDLDVEVTARPDTPFWDKQVDEVKITFSRLGFKPLKMGGLVDQAMLYQRSLNRGGAGDAKDGNLRPQSPWSLSRESPPTNLFQRWRDLSNADEAFREIDVDNSGFLDRQEIREALLLASGVHGGETFFNSNTKNTGYNNNNNNMADVNGQRQIIEKLASDLLELYDVNGDGLISRSEYQLMVEDMAALVNEHNSSNNNNNEELPSSPAADNKDIVAGESSIIRGIGHFLRSAVGSVGRFFGSWFSWSDKGSTSAETVIAAEEAIARNATDAGFEIVKSTESMDLLVDSVSNREYGSITLSDLKLDLRRLVFGGVPLIKHITPGGPLILEPFTVTVNGSFTRDDILKSPILEDGLSRLIAMVLRRRVRSLRDMIDMAVLFGRDYKLTSKNAPVTELVNLSNVEFDNKNRLVMTGKAKVRTRPMAPTIEQTFKVRAKLGTRKGGRVIRLVEPELAFVLECPKKLEESVEVLFRKMDMEPPPRPQPLYSFFPIYSPFKPDDNDGFDMGEDNTIHNIYIQDKALRFELSSVLRPGRFLGSHYIAFTLPFRTFIITLDRVKEGIRAARKAKKIKKELERLQMQSAGSEEEKELILASVDSETLRQKKPLKKNKRPPRKNFFSRFVDGYMQAEREEPDRARIALAIRDFFGRQMGSSNTTQSTTSTAATASKNKSD